MLEKGIVRFSLVLLLIVGGLALSAPWLGLPDPEEVNLAAKLSAPSAQHLLGTDHLGRDVLSRLIFGSRVSIGSVFVILLLIVVFSTLAGTLAGFAEGAVDNVIMRICDIFLTFPTLILAMFFVGVLGTGLTNVIIAIFLTHWAWYARIVRGIVLSLKSREFVLAARVAGTSTFRLVVRHILPSLAPQVLVLSTLDIGHMMLHVAGLSFLGLGVQPPLPEWGVMIGDARQFIWTQPQLLLYPGLAIFIVVMAFNLLGDAMRDALDRSGMLEEGVK
ncbi:MAG: nickel ABC transporter permease subunit NikC [Aminobacteriaceae bacterium]|nr:nickel ABC transporter permease subunit NikC [Synergistaceae bacterium]MDD3390271.1 nickel ABC transporter permease subunit NikC [Synergistaceae bacterium]MDD4021789.1 nickel ABC transporter permease subunit NikC [Synergistaceae bacterium]MDD4612864.1 nickel ABC transporter permease subunit NikC [Synergistaceae bacterium]